MIINYCHSAIDQVVGRRDRMNMEAQTCEQAIKDPEISEDEFGRIFEIGEKAREENKPNISYYKNSYRRLAFSDGWEAKNAELTNPELLAEK